jgi:hypothetical protein
MNIDAITVSIDYSDYLEQIVSNKDKFTRWLIVTHWSDKKTIDLCKKYSLDYMLSEEIYADGACFAKSRAINEAIRHLNPHDWLCVLDSDSLLPNDFNSIVETCVNDKEAIYGCIRYTRDGVRKIENFDGAYNYPAGFFQLWHTSKFNDYYVGDMTNTEGDLQHKNRFEKSQLLPLKLVDMQKESGFKENWYGRGPIGKTRHRLYANNQSI